MPFHHHNKLNTLGLTRDLPILEIKEFDPNRLSLFSFLAPTAKWESEFRKGTYFGNSLDILNQAARDRILQQEITWNTIIEILGGENRSTNPGANNTFGSGDLQNLYRGVISYLIGTSRAKIPVVLHPNTIIDSNLLGIDNSSISDDAYPDGNATFSSFLSAAEIISLASYSPTLVGLLDRGYKIKYDGDILNPDDGKIYNSSDKIVTVETNLLYGLFNSISNILDMLRRLRRLGHKNFIEGWLDIDKYIPVVNTSSGKQFPFLTANHKYVYYYDFEIDNASGPMYYYNYRGNYVGVPGTSPHVARGLIEVIQLNNGVGGPVDINFAGGLIYNPSVETNTSLSLLRNLPAATAATEHNLSVFEWIPFTDNNANNNTTIIFRRMTAGELLIDGILALEKRLESFIGDEGHTIKSYTSISKSGAFAEATAGAPALDAYLQAINTVNSDVSLSGSTIITPSRFDQRIYQETQEKVYGLWDIIDQAEVNPTRFMRSSDIDVRRPFIATHAIKTVAGGNMYISTGELTSGTSTDYASTISTISLPSTFTNQIVKLATEYTGDMFIIDLLVKSSPGLQNYTDQINISTPDVLKPNSIIPSGLIIRTFSGINTSQYDNSRTVFGKVADIAVTVFPNFTITLNTMLSKKSLTSIARILLDASKIVNFLNPYKDTNDIAQLELEFTPNIVDVYGNRLLDIYTIKLAIDLS